MLKVTGVDNADLARSQPGRRHVRRRVGRRSTTPSFDFGRPAGPDAEHCERRGHQLRRQPGPRARAPPGSPGSRARSTTTAGSSGRRRRAAGAAMTVPFDQVGGWGKGRGRSGAWTSGPRRLHMLYESPSADVLDFPDNVTTSARGTLIVCEDGGAGNYLRGLTRTGELFDIAKNNLAGHGGRRRVRRRDVQPGRRDAVRQHPGHHRDVVRDLGAVGHARRLTRAREADGRAGLPCVVPVIIGVGIDVVDVARFSRTLDRTPRLRDPAVHRRRAAAAAGLAGGPLRCQGGARQGARRAGRACAGATRRCTGARTAGRTCPCRGPSRRPPSSSAPGVPTSP